MRRARLLILLTFLIHLTAFSQIKIGRILKNESNRVKEKILDKAVEGWEKMSREYDESNFNYAISFLDNSGIFEADEKGSAFASDLLLGAKMSTKQLRSTEDYAYTNLKNGEMLMAGNKPYLAEQSFRAARLLYESNGLMGSTNYAQVICDLGLVYQSTGRLVKAKKFDLKALELREHNSNRDMQVVSMNNFAVLEKDLGQYVEAETDLKQALSIAGETKNQLAQGLIYNNLAMTYLDMNKLEDAEAQMKKSISTVSPVLDSSAANFIKLQINLANIYRFEKKYELAEKLYLDAMAVKERKLGAHPDLAHLQRGLAQLYLEMGRTDTVEKLLLRAYDIDKGKLGPRDPATLSVQQELANYYRFMNKPDRALELISPVVERKKEIYGENHPNYLQSLEDLALAQWLNKNIVEAKSNYRKVIDNTLNYIRNYFSSLNENEKTLYWEKTNGRLQRFYSFALENGANDQDLVNQFYDVVINTKGFLLNTSTKIRNIIAASSDQDLQEAYEQWLETKESLNQAYQMSKEEMDKDKVNLDSLKGRADELERELSQRSALFRETNSLEVADAGVIMKALDKNEMAAEIVEVNEYVNGFTGKASFVALLVSPTGIKMIRLGDSEAIQDAIGSFRKNVVKQGLDDKTYNLVWKPADEQMQGVVKLYLSVDGDYHQMSINGLKDQSGKYLVDKYAIQMVSNTRDIASMKSASGKAGKPSSAFLVGNPQFGKNAGVAPLPATEEEVKGIAKILGKDNVETTTILGSNATEDRVKEVNSPSILHIATHGYFLADLNKVKTEKILGEDIAAARQNPLLRSGILLANCENVFNKDYHPVINNENGVLTAYEAMSLNLDKTDLVILSACETGLGTIKQGEGVYGLQRAFLISGAQSIIMSLWKVDDVATRELMTLFYSNYTKTGDKSSAFLDAIRQLKLKYKHPYFWGGFILLDK